MDGQVWLNCSHLMRNFQKKILQNGIKDISPFFLQKADLLTLDAIFLKSINISRSKHFNTIYAKLVSTNFIICRIFHNNCLFSGSMSIYKMERSLHRHPKPTGWFHIVLNYIGPNNEGIRIYYNGTEVVKWHNQGYRVPVTFSWRW